MEGGWRRRGRKPSVECGPAVAATASGPELQTVFPQKPKIAGARAGFRFRFRLGPGPAGPAAGTRLTL